LHQQLADAGQTKAPTDARIPHRSAQGGRDQP
jgi:hypothetical protein